MTVPGGKMTLEKLAAMVAEGFSFVSAEIREVRAEIHELRERVDFLETSTNAKFFTLNNRIDDILETLAKRTELAATNARVTRIEGRLGLA
jgi:polyhydroxyalkanoate synthesis regulator phasin